MKFPWKFTILLVILVGLALAVRDFYQSATFKLSSLSPNGENLIKGLPFKGINHHPLDGNLRIYIGGGEAWQTTIPWGKDLKINWHMNSNDTFSISKNGKDLMTWKIETEGGKCTSGAELITYDPHELWGRTGHSRY